MSIKDEKLKKEQAELEKKEMDKAALEAKKAEKNEAKIVPSTPKSVIKECIAILDKGINEHISRVELMELKTKLEGLSSE